MRDFSKPTLDLVHRFSGHMARRLTQFPNVRLYDYREASQITCNLNNYMDLIHHSPAVDAQVLSMLRDDLYRVDAANPQASSDRLKSQVDAYRLQAD
jgi:hypothetical protein